MEGSVLPAALGKGLGGRDEQEHPPLPLKTGNCISQGAPAERKAGSDPMFLSMLHPFPAGSLG